MLIDDLLRKKGGALFSVAPDTTIDRAIALLRTENIGALIVSAVGRLAGLLSEREVVQALWKHGPGITLFEVQHIMVPDPPSASIDERVDHLMAIMTRQRMRHVPITRDGAVVGLLSVGDVIASRLEELACENAVLQDIARARLAFS